MTDGNLKRFRYNGHEKKIEVLENKESYDWKRFRFNSHEKKIKVLKKKKRIIEFLEHMINIGVDGDPADCINPVEWCGTTIIKEVKSLITLLSKRASDHIRKDY